MIEEEEKREKHDFFTGILIDGSLYIRRSKHHELGTYSILIEFHQSNNTQQQHIQGKIFLEISHLLCVDY